MLVVYVAQRTIGTVAPNIGAKRKKRKNNKKKCKCNFIFLECLLLKERKTVLFCQQVARFLLSGDSSLYILLPHSNTLAALQQVEKKMTDTAVNDMIKHMKTVPPELIDVTLPLIKLDTQPDMYILIKKLGLSIFQVLIRQTQFNLFMLQSNYQPKSSVSVLSQKCHF